MEGGEDIMEGGEEMTWDWADFLFTGFWTIINMSIGFYFGYKYRKDISRRGKKNEL